MHIVAPRESEVTGHKIEHFLIPIVHGSIHYVTEYLSFSVRLRCTYQRVRKSPKTVEQRS